MSGLGQCDNTGTETHSFNTFCVLDCTFHQMCDQDNILDPFLVLFDKARTMGMGNSYFSPEYLLVMAVAVLVVMGIQP